MAADEALAARLSIAPMTPLLSLEQVMYDEEARHLCFSTVALRADRVAFFSRVGRSDGGDALRPLRDDSLEDLGFS